MTTRKINAILRNAGIPQSTQKSLASSGFSSELVGESIWIGYFSFRSAQIEQRMNDIQNALAEAGIKSDRRGTRIVVSAAA